jgi:opacity protein-like surface antigen
MKMVKAILIGMFVLGICKPVGAADDGVKYFANVDMFAAGTAADRAKHIMHANQVAGGFGTYSLKTEDAVGGRIGALYAVEGIADVGISAGYIAGPNGSLTIDGVKFYKSMDRNFYRFLAEGRRDFKVTDKISVLGGAGIGMAFGRQKYTYETAQAVSSVNNLLVTSIDRSFNGFTWEASAGVSYKATEKMSVDLGVRYAGFPACSNTVDGKILGMKWNSLGAFAGVRF